MNSIIWFNAMSLQSLKNILIVANGADPDEMLHFHLVTICQSVGFGVSWVFKGLMHQNISIKKSSFGHYLAIDTVIVLTNGTTFCCINIYSVFIFRSVSCNICLTLVRLTKFEGERGIFTYC